MFNGNVFRFGATTLGAVLVVGMLSIPSHAGFKDFMENVGESIGSTVQKVTGQNQRTESDAATSEPPENADERLPNGEEMRQLQSALKQLGYDPKGVDGRFGPGTGRAIELFQAAERMPIDGRPTIGVLSRAKKLVGQSRSGRSASAGTR